MVFAQTSETDQWYQNLDIFLENPSPETFLRLKKQIKNLQTSSNSAKLAKVITYTNLGYYTQQHNDLNKSISFYEEAKNIFFNNALSNYNIIEYCLKPLGNLYTKTNSFSEAESIIKQYLLLAQRQKNKPLETAALLNLSVVYKSVGQYDRAISLLSKALVYNPKNIQLQLQLAQNFIFKKNFNEAENLLNLLQQQYPNVSKIYVLRSQIALQKKQIRQAKDFLLKALIIDQETPNILSRNLAKTFLKLSKVQFQLNNIAEATKNINKSYQLIIPNYEIKQNIPETSQLFAENTLLDVLDLHADIAYQENKLEQAILLYQKADYVSQLLLKISPLRQSKTIQQTHRKNRFEKVLNIVYTLYKKSGDKQWLQKALSIDANSKSFVVTQNQQLQTFLNQHLEDSLVKKYFLINARLEKANSTLLRLTLQKKTNIKLVHQIQNNYSGLVTQQRSVFKKLKEKYPAITLNNIEFSLEKLQKKLQATNQTVVSYFFGSKSVFQFQISKDTLVFHKLLSTKIERDSLFSLCVTINGFYKNASEINNRPQEYIDVAFKLYSKLNIPKKRKLVIIPDGILSFIPFDALVTSKTHFTNYKNIPFLVFQNKLNYRLSLSNFQFENNNNLKEETVILGLFPEFKNTKKELRFSNIEAKAIKNHFNSKIVSGKDATIQAFLTNLNNYDVIHLSTHARGGTFTSAPVIEFADGELSVNNIYGRNLKTQLMILSACETGVGNIIKGEGVINLARGFAYSGTRNVIFSLWNVNDFSTSWLMQEFYKELSNKNTSINALTIAKQNYLQSNDISNSKKSPFYWASFVYYGEAITLYPSSSIFWIWAAIFLVCFGLLLFLIYHKTYGSLLR